MKYAIISGSQRQNSGTLKAAHLIESYLKKTLHSETFLLSLEDKPLPLWDDSAWNDSSELSQIWKPIADHLSACDALIVLAPEWHGMVPSALKNFFLFCNRQTVGHKPALIVSVSAGIGGTYPVNELRVSSYKNNRICYIPEHVILRNVNTFVEEYENPGSEIIKHLKDRLHYSLDLLEVYAESMKPVRDSKLAYPEEFSNGM